MAVIVQCKVCNEPSCLSDTTGRWEHLGDEVPLTRLILEGAAVTTYDHPADPNVIDVDSRRIE